MILDAFTDRRLVATPHTFLSIYLVVLTHRRSCIVNAVASLLRLMVIWYITALNNLRPVKSTVYIAEGVLHAKFLFSKNWEIRRSFVILFSSLRESSRFRLFTVENRTASSISKSNGTSYVEKDALYIFLYLLFFSLRFLASFSQEHIKEAIVLDTVVDLIPVTLICNHEAEATELCRTCHALALSFLLP